MRLATLLVALVACNDLRDFEGEWSGRRVGDDPALRVGVAGDARATLAIDGIDKHGLRGRLSIEGLAAGPVAGVELVSLAGAEADALATTSFAGSPLRVYFAFASAPGGELLAVIALYDAGRIEVRVLRGGTSPVYAVFALGEV